MQMKNFILFEHPVSKPRVIIAGFSWKAFWLNVFFFLYHKRFGTAFLCFLLNLAVVFCFYAFEQKAFEDFKKNHFRWKVTQEFGETLVEDLQQNLLERSLGDSNMYLAAYKAKEAEALRFIENDWQKNKKIPFILGEIGGIMLVGLIFAFKQGAILASGLRSRGFEETYQAEAETEEMFWAKYKKHQMAEKNN